MAELRKVLYGCECTDCDPSSNRCARGKAPVAFRVRRAGKEINVCSRCDLSRDEKIACLIYPDSPADPYFDYDPLIIGIIDEVKAPH